jgi:transmembrane sensor
MSGEKERPEAVPSIALSDEAIDWLVRLSSGRATAKDRLAFLRWRGLTPAHEAAAREAEQIQRALGQTRQADRVRRHGEPMSFTAPPFANGSPRRGLGRRSLFAAAAASVAAVAVGLPTVWPLAALYADHATAVGERKRIVLADGSTVFLNTDTALSVDYGGQDRRLVLHHGQALFEVARDPVRPFVVVADGTEARALGTIFAVQRTETCADVIVTEGAVEVRVGTQGAVRLEAGQRLAFGAHASLEPRTIDAEAATAWQRGKLIFNRRPLQSVVAELERYRAGRIVVLGERLKTLEITGVFDLDDPDRLLRTIEETTKAKVVHMPLLTVIR